MHRKIEHIAKIGAATVKNETKVRSITGFTTVSANRVLPYNYKPTIRYVAILTSGFFFAYSVLSLHII